MTSYRGGEIVREAEILSLEEMERRHIGRVLSINKGNMSVAARILGIGRTTLYRKIEALDIDCSDMGQCSESEQHLAATAVPF